jgi:hypothetical protein
MISYPQNTGTTNSNRFEKEHSLFMLSSSEDDSYNNSNQDINVTLIPPDFEQASQLVLARSFSSCPLRSSLRLTELRLRCQSFEEKHYKKLKQRVRLTKNGKIAEDLSFTKKSFYENLLEAELFQYYQSSGSIKEIVLSIINTKDGSKFLQGLLKDLPKECFRLLFLEVIIYSFMNIR